MNFVFREKIFGTALQLIFLSLFIFLLGASLGNADVLISDDVCLKGETIMLQVQTKGNFFSKGGELVEFIINGKSLGKNLSGGDGYAFREFTPTKTGLYKISVTSRNESDNGFLLSLKKGAEIVFIDVEGSLFFPFSSKDPMPGSQKVVKAISKKFNIVYIQSGMFNIKTLKKWLAAHNFPKSPVLLWRSGGVFDAIYKKGIKIKYVIGSQAVIDSAREYKPEVFSLRETDNEDHQVKNWAEIGKKMKLVIK